MNAHAVNFADYLSAGCFLKHESFFKTNFVGPFQNLEQVQDFLSGALLIYTYCPWRLIVWLFFVGTNCILMKILKKKI